MLKATMRSVIRPLAIIALALTFVTALHLLGSMAGTVSTAEAAPMACNPCVCETDRRVNCLGHEFFAIYTRVDPVTEACSIDAWRIHGNGEQVRVWRLTARQLARIEDEPEENTLIIEGEGIALYRLTSGEFLVNAGPAAENKVFTVIFENCPAEDVREETWVAE